MSGTTPKRILIIEDNESYLKVLKMRLEANGYETITARDGLAGLAAVRKEKPDLVISDLLLPSLDGNKITRFLKFDQQCRNIPLIILTSRDLDEYRKKAMECGANAFIPKTEDTDVILDIIKKLLDGESA